MEQRYMIGLLRSDFSQPSKSSREIIKKKNEITCGIPYIDENQEQGVNINIIIHKIEIFFEVNFKQKKYNGIIIRVPNTIFTQFIKEGRERAEILSAVRHFINSKIYAELDQTVVVIGVWPDEKKMESLANQAASGSPNPCRTNGA